MGRIITTTAAGLKVTIRLLLLCAAGGMALAVQTVLAQAAPVLADLPDAVPGAAAWWAPLVNMGAIGIVLGWFMIRMEPRMRAIEAAIDTISLALMVTVLALKNLDKSISEQAQGIKDRLDAKAAKDKPV